MIKTNGLILEKLYNILKTLHFFNAMKVEEFLNIPNEDIVFEVLEDDQIIADLVNTFKRFNEENFSSCLLSTGWKSDLMCLISW